MAALFASPNTLIELVAWCAECKHTSFCHYCGLQNEKTIAPECLTNTTRRNKNTQSPKYYRYTLVLQWSPRKAGNIWEGKETGAGCCKAQAWCRHCPGSEKQAAVSQERGHWWWWCVRSGLIWNLRNRSVRSRSSSSSRRYRSSGGSMVASSWDSYRRMLRVSS